MGRFIWFWALLASLVVVASCGKEQAQVAGGESTQMIALVGGQVRAVAADEQETLCATHYCEPNYIYSTHLGAKKPNPEKEEFQDYSREIMKVKDAWKKTKGSREIIVAVVDTGVDYNHPDLVDNIWVNSADGSKGYDFVNDDNDPMDDNKHGTHVAGIIGAQMNKKGTVGVSPLVKIMALKFLAANGNGTTLDAIAAIDFAVEHGAHIISNSWGGGGRSELLNDAVQRAVARGILVVAAAGNEKTDNDVSPHYPSNYDNVISVGSTNANDNWSSFSNYGKKTVMIAAPGSDIYSSLPSKKWGYLSGTSMATPQVSGALALALSLGKNYTASELTDRLCQTAKKTHLGHARCGRMNVGAFVQKVSDTFSE